MNFIHKELAKGGWYALSLAEQMGNIGSEVGRAADSEGKDDRYFNSYAAKALDLFDLTLQDPRWIEQPERLREIARAREVFCDAIFGGKEYRSSLHDLDEYFLMFALAARRNLS